MNRREKILSGLDVRNLVGVEIGALCRPIVSRDDGPIFYVDHADTETLRAKYRGDPDVDGDALVAVDGIWGSNTLAEALGHQKVDYVIASHVVEHVPNLVGWLAEIDAVLKHDGRLHLVVPDKRFTFDVARDESRMSDVLAAHIANARSPQPQAILDFVLNARHGVNAARIWLGQQSQGEPAHSFEDAIAVAKNAIETGTYHDVHCWVFTPARFAQICAALTEHGLLNMSCVEFFDTASNELEFHVHMQVCDDRARALASWRRMEYEAKLSEKRLLHGYHLLVRQVKATFSRTAFAAVQKLPRPMRDAVHQIKRALR